MKTRYHIMQRLTRLSEEMAELTKELSTLDAKTAEQPRQAKPALPPKPKATPQAQKPPAKPAYKAHSATPVAATPPKRTAQSFSVSEHELTLNVGAFAVKDLAERDAHEFLSRPTVFWYRAAQFPDPRRHNVQPRVEGAKVVKRVSPKFANAPYTVSLSVYTDGDDKKALAWNQGALTKNRAEQE